MNETLRTSDLPTLVKHVMTYSPTQDPCSSFFGCFYFVLACAGPIPKELGALTDLKKIVLFDNQLTGKAF